MVAASPAREGDPVLPRKSLPTSIPAVTAPAAAPTPPRRLTVRPWKLVRSSPWAMGARQVDQDRAVPAALIHTLARSRAQELTRVIVPAMDSA